LAAIALFFFVFGTRLLLIHAWGSPVPIGDEWDADAFGIFRAWLNSTLRWSDLFAAHNEHRIALTRISNLSLLIVEGRWNLWSEMMLGAALHAGCAAALFRLLANALSPSSRCGMLVGIAVLFASTAGWQNALWGFQTQVYFANLLTVVAIGGMLGSKPLKPIWWIGWSAALLALFSNGSGVFAVVAILAVALLDMVTARRRPQPKMEGAALPRLPSRDPELVERASAPLSELAETVVRPSGNSSRAATALATIAVLVVLGFALRVDVPFHAPLKARNFAEFYAVFARSLAWPQIDSAWLWPIVQAPVLWLTVDLIRRRSRPDSFERFTLALAIVAMLHAAAIAYSRGAGLIEARPLSRYQDPFLLGAAANLFILLRYGSTHRASRIAALGWIGVVLAGLMSITTSNFSLHLPYKSMQDRANLAMVRDYLDHHDPAVFARDPYFPGPHPEASSVIRVLDNPQLRSILPSELLGRPSAQPWLIEHALIFAGCGVMLLLAVLLTEVHGGAKVKKARPAPHLSKL